MECLRCLRRDKRWRPTHHCVFGHPAHIFGVSFNKGQPKVDEFDLLGVFVDEKDVLRFEVSVHQGHFVGRL